MNQKITSGSGFVVLLMVILTIVYFVWMVERNKLEPVFVSQVAMSEISKTKTIESNPVITEEDQEPSRPANLCKGLSEEPGIGDSYPIAEKYSHLAFLGELFTASDCSNQRVLEINSGSDERKNGIKLFLHTAPSDKFKATLESIGFSCEEGLTASCTRWSFEKPIKLQELLKLKPFADEIEVDDCIICG